MGWDGDTDAERNVPALSMRVGVHGDETARRHLPPRRQGRQERREAGERRKGRRNDTAYGWVLGVFGGLSWRREGLIFGFVDVPVGGQPSKSAVAKENLDGRRQDSLGVLGVLAVNAVVGRERVLRKVPTGSWRPRCCGTVT